MKAKVLFISYDGMTDPLGQSQVIPYLSGLVQLGYAVSILSFEKEDRLQKHGNYIGELLESSSITWHHEHFNQGIKAISKFKDLFALRNAAKRLHKQHNYDIIHARSYLAADIGLYLKKRTGVKLLFDMRGFWADEKKEGGNWDTSKLLWKNVYNYYKRLEKKLVQQSDHIVSLTKTGKEEIESWPFYNNSIPISVIPCCSNDRLFTQQSPGEKQLARKELGINSSEFVLSYLGSVGSWYMLDEMFLFFNILKEKKVNCKFLFITNSEKDVITTGAKKNNVLSDDLIITSVLHKDVPKFMKASDLSVSFIKDVYSKKGSSPTKTGEILNMGIPLVMNNIGDAAEIHKRCCGTTILSGFSREQIASSIEGLDQLLQTPAADIRNDSIGFFGLQEGIDNYNSCYERLANSN